MTSISKIQEFKVDGMSCASCVSRVEKALLKIPGVIEAQVNLATERAHVTYDPSLADPLGVAAILTEKGYETSVLEKKSP